MTRAEAVKFNLPEQVLEAPFQGCRSIIVFLFTPEGARGNEHSKAAVDLVSDADALFRDSGS